MEFDLFDQQELGAYVTVTHRCLLKAVENLMKELGQDFSRLSARAKDFWKCGKVLDLISLVC